MGVYVTVTPLGGQEARTRVWKTGVSSYYQGLEKKTKERYELKLKVAGLSLQDDPYSSDRSGQWSTKLVSWSKIEYGDIFLLLAFSLTTTSQHFYLKVSQDVS